jgi:type II secretory pathway pseudopilin PulG
MSALTPPRPFSTQTKISGAPGLAFETWDKKSGAPSIPQLFEEKMRNGWDKHSPTQTKTRNPSEDGYILIAVVFMLALFIIALAVAAPRVAKSIQREREIETMHRGKQYARAVKLYYRRFGRYPPNVAALVNTNEIRFLRKKYIDPTTGKADWKPIAVGMNKTQSTGFFGLPVVGGGATGLSGSPGMAGSLAGASASGSAFSNAGSSSAGGSGLFSSSPGTATPTTDPSSAGASAPTTDANGNPVAATESTSTTAGSPFGSSPTLGGPGIMGFSPNSPKPSILVWHKKVHYNEWEFFYDPLADLTMQAGRAGAIGQPAGSTPIGTGAGIGNTPASNTFGNSSSSFGSSSGSSPTSGTSQQ